MLGAVSLVLVASGTLLALAAALGVIDVSGHGFSFSLFWVAFANTFLGIVIGWLMIWLAWRDTAKAIRVVRVNGTSFVVLAIGFIISFGFVPGLFTSFLFLGVAALVGLVVSAWNMERLRERDVKDWRNR